MIAGNNEKAVPSVNEERSGLVGSQLATFIAFALVLFTIYVFAKKHCVTGLQIPITAISLAYLVAYLAGTLPGRFFGTGNYGSVTFKVSSGLGIFLLTAVFIVSPPAKDRITASCVSEKELVELSQKTQQLQNENYDLKVDAAVERLMGQLSMVMVDFRDLQRYEAEIRQPTTGIGPYTVNGLIGGLAGLRTYIYRENEEIKKSVNAINSLQISISPGPSTVSGTGTKPNKEEITAGAYTSIAYVLAKSCMIGALSQDISHGEPFLQEAIEYANCGIRASETTIDYIDTVIAGPPEPQNPTDPKYLELLKERDEFKKQVDDGYYKDNLHFVQAVSYIVQYVVQHKRMEQPQQGTNEEQAQRKELAKKEIMELKNKIKDEFHRDNINLDYLRIRLRPQMHNMITWFCNLENNRVNFPTPCGLD